MAPTVSHAPMEMEPEPVVVSPQLAPPLLFVSWDQVAEERGLPTWHKDGDSCPSDEIDKALAQPGCLSSGEKELFLAANQALLQRLRNQVMPLEHIAPDVFQAIYQQQQAEFSWNTLLWKVAQRNQFWIGYDALPLPHLLQINCSGLGGGTLDGSVPPHFHCTCPQVGDSQVYVPSLSPADVVQKERTEPPCSCIYRIPNSNCPECCSPAPSAQEAPT